MSASGNLHVCMLLEHELRDVARLLRALHEHRAKEDSDDDECGRLLVDFVTAATIALDSLTDDMNVVLLTSSSVRDALAATKP